MKQLFTLLLSAFALAAQAQTAPAWTWASSLGSANTTTVPTVAADAAGNTYVAGSFTQPLTLAPGTVLTSTAGQDGYVAKYSPTGTLLWHRQLAGSFNDYVQQVVLDATGKLTLLAMSSDGAQFGGSTFESDAFGPVLLLAQLDAQGQALSLREVGNGGLLVPSDLALDAAGNAYISGTFALSTTFGSITLETPLTGTSFAIDQFVLKVSAQGTPLWAQQGGRSQVSFDGSGTFGFGVFLSALAVEPGGDAYLTWSCNAAAGSFGSLAQPAGFGDYDVEVVKFNAQGTPQWLRRAGSAGLDYAGHPTLDPSGRLVVPGFVTGAGTFGSQSLAAVSPMTGYLWMLEPAAGATTWVRPLSGTQAAFRGVVADAAGNLYATAQFSGQASLGSAPTTLTSAGSLDGLVASYSAAGALRWVQQTGGAGDEVPISIALDGAGRVAVAGLLRGAGQFGPLALTSQGSTSVGNGFVAHLGSTVTATRAGQVAAALALYPNPAAASAAVTLPALPAGTQLTLTDALGRVAGRQPVTQRLSLAGRAPGIYLVQATAPDGRQWTTRLVVE